MVRYTLELEFGFSFIFKDLTGIVLLNVGFVTWTGGWCSNVLDNLQTEATLNCELSTAIFEYSTSY